MQEPKFPSNEQERLEALQAYNVLDTLPEQDFTDLVLLASTICLTPIALISLVDSDRQWFKAKVGIDADQTARNISFCGHAILQEQILIVPNATTDQRFADNPLVSGDLGIRFYAGAQLVSPEGHAIGTLCVIDQKPRQLTAEQIVALAAISRQVIAQLELRKQIKNLASTQLELVKARNEALLANQVKRQFLANMSHEIRTPINGVIGLTHVLAQTKLDTEQYELTEGLLNCANILRKLVDDILDFSKMESGLLQLEQSRYDLRKTIRSCLMPLTLFAKQKNLSLTIELPEDLPELVGDSFRVSQVLLNLVNNAIKFTEFGGVIVRLSVTQDSSLLLSIIDTGPGLSAATQTKLFADFFQADPSTTRIFGGSGLGLSICKKLMQLMGGEIGCRSQLDQGSTFWVKWPILKTVARAPDPESQISLNLPLLHGHILLAEDNLINQKVAVAILTKFGLKVDVAADGVEALRLWEQDIYDLILMDGQMPILDGYKACQKIRILEQERAIPSIPIIALTASVSLDEREHCLNVGMNGVINKPFSLENLREILAHWLEQSPKAKLNSNQTRSA